MSKKRILVLGAGLAGLSAAWHLQRRGMDCRVFEQEAEVGGLCRSKNIGGFVFDFDGHLLHFKHAYTFNLVKNLLGDNLFEHKRSAWVYSYGKYTRYPFQANFYGLPKPVVQDCFLGLIEAHNNGHKKIDSNRSFYDWIIHTFGKGVARHFMVPYNTKFWTQHPRRLTCEWLGDFIPTPSLKEVIEGTIEESQIQFGYNARFWYPKKGGINQLPLAFAAQVRNIHTGCQVTEIDLVKKEIKTNMGDKERFDYLISTLPLPEMPHMIKGLSSKIGPAFNRLKWNSVFNLNLGIEKKDSGQKHWIYFPQKELCFFRVGFLHNFSPVLAPPGKGSLYVEVAYSRNRPIEKDNIIMRIKKDLVRAGLLVCADAICTQDVNDIKYGYPIYDKNYRVAREQIISYLARNDIIPAGRYGSWSYSSMEDVILDGRRAAAQL